MQMPIMIDLTNMNVVVIGGGKIATRRVSLLLEYTSQIHVVSPHITDILEQLVRQQQITWEEKSFEASDVNNADLVIAATNQAHVNDEIKNHISPHTLFNHVGNAQQGNITFPNQLRRGRLTISVSTEGASPKLGKQIIQDLSETYDKSYENYIDFLYEARQLIKMKVVNPSKKHQLLKDILSEKYFNQAEQQSFISWLESMNLYR
ncbi:NAD(P)-binding protein [Staphylococcus pasteuri]|uniref:NAD(P)-binding protein n=1 Tax=Staphylococcus pasteuri TaxID=45972 RepID=UPI003D030305